MLPQNSSRVTHLAGLLSGRTQPTDRRSVWTLGTAAYRVYLSEQTDDATPRRFSPFGLHELSSARTSPADILGLALAATVRNEERTAAYLLGVVGHAATRHAFLMAAEGVCLSILRVMPTAGTCLERAHAIAMADEVPPVEVITAVERCRVAAAGQDNDGVLRWAAIANSGIARYGFNALTPKVTRLAAEKQQHAKVTGRELEVLAYVALGFNDRETSRLMGLSPHTVSNHVRHLRSKIGTATRAEAVAWAVNHDLIAVP